MKKSKKKQKKRADSKSKSNSVKKSLSAKAKAKPAIEVDRANRRAGTQGFLINTKLNSKPLSNVELAKATKLPVRRVCAHTSDMVRKHFYKKTKDGKYTWAKK